MSIMWSFTNSAHSICLKRLLKEEDPSGELSAFNIQIGVSGNEIKGRLVLWPFFSQELDEPEGFNAGQVRAKGLELGKENIFKGGLGGLFNFSKLIANEKVAYGLAIKIAQD